jgi:hypothetical protein
VTKGGVFAHLEVLVVEWPGLGLRVASLELLKDGVATLLLGVRRGSNREIHK